MPQMVNGVGLNIFGVGVILTGDSGSGKSELALELVSRGHKIIADDSVYVTLTNKKLVMKALVNKFIMHLRDIGFIDIESIFDSDHTLSISNLDMIIKLTQEPHKSPLEPTKNKVTLLGQEVIESSLYMGTNKPLCIITETLVKYHKLLNNGIDSHQDFIKYHTELIKENAQCK